MSEGSSKGSVLFPNHLSKAPAARTPDTVTRPLGFRVLGAHTRDGGFSPGGEGKAASSPAPILTKELTFLLEQPICTGKMGTGEKITRSACGLERRQDWSLGS